MKEAPREIADFLTGRRFAVTGVSRDGKQASNAVYRKLKQAGYEVIPVNPRATEVEGVVCFPDLASIPGKVDGVVVVSPPDASADLIGQCARSGIERVWLHRSFGNGSVEDAAVQAARAAGIRCIVGGCPLMYCEPVDVAHRCLRWWLGRRGRIPA